MPQKTRHQKIEAAKRRQFRLVISDTHTPLAQDKQEKVIVEAVNDEEYSTTKSYLLPDLRKSLLLIGSIFALEIFLYFVTIGNHIR